ncbi:MULTISPECIES: hypothetical protein [Stenotrophomonas]|uniref:hypothetical protein n=1 Tax=Stenotrophomonas geniculata TaxID=86188 RepID=UPI001CCE49DA
MATKKAGGSESDVALKALDLLQELIWSIGSRDSRELMTGVSHLRGLAKSEKMEQRKAEAKSTSKDRRKDLKALVGSLSLVLADTELFPSNEDIAKFAEEALHISINRWDKRSRYEMIGMLVTESINASPKLLTQVGRLLAKISDESDSMEKIKKSSRETGFSWNEAIRSLSTSVE